MLAAYGGVFVAGSLAYGMGVEKNPPRPLQRRRRGQLPGRGRHHHARPARRLTGGASVPCARRLAPRNPWTRASRTWHGASRD
ncbi:hypothetical protein ACTMS2_13275 [Micromonospora sp. SD12]|uniref:hypothetical protein n=1 Tax=Micromonospora sp. SD12 TaxID=3452216 RepID=UPI003F8AE11D